MSSPLGTAIKEFIDNQPTKPEQLYAARYAHWLVEQPDVETGRDVAKLHAEASKQGIPSRNRLKIRRGLLKIVTGQDWSAA